LKRSIKVLSPVLLAALAVVALLILKAHAADVTNPTVAPAGATFQSSISGNGLQPVGTASTTFVMMGLGTTCKITPTSNGRVHFTIGGNMLNATNGMTTRVELAFGTGAAPVNGAAVTGTVLAGPRGSIGASSELHGFSTDAVVTGLVPGTTYWFDTPMNTDSTGTASVTNVMCNAVEG